MPKGRKLTVNEAEIALRAYQIWEAEGHPQGKDFEHWLKAEAELATSSAGEKPAAARRAPARKPAEKKPPERKTPVKRV